MTRDELERMADWLRDRADAIEAEEPYATNTIAALREAADVVDSADASDE